MSFHRTVLVKKTSSMFFNVCCRMTGSIRTFLKKFKHENHSILGQHKSMCKQGCSLLLLLEATGQVAMPASICHIQHKNLGVGCVGLARWPQLPCCCPVETSEKTNLCGRKFPKMHWKLSTEI